MREGLTVAQRLRRFGYDGSAPAEDWLECKGMYAWCRPIISVQGNVQFKSYVDTFDNQHCAGRFSARRPAMDAAIALAARLLELKYNGC